MKNRATISDRRSGVGIGEGDILEIICRSAGLAHPGFASVGRAKNRAIPSHYCSGVGIGEGDTSEIVSLRQRVLPEPAILREGDFQADHKEREQY